MLVDYCNKLIPMLDLDDGFGIQILDDGTVPVYGKMHEPMEFAVSALRVICCTVSSP